MDLSKFIKSNDILSDLCDEVINILSASAQLTECSPKETVLKISDFNRFLWIVYEGEGDTRNYH